ncbi:MAG: M23 family metallopeptidase [Patescibacteria group bacterium]
MKISLIKEKIANIRRFVSITTVIPVVFVLGASLLNLRFLMVSAEVPSGFGGPQQRGLSIGGSAFLLAQEAFAEESPLLNIDQFQELDISIANTDEDLAGFILIESSALENSNSPLGSIVSNRNGLLTYKVQSGDTLSKIAANFDISLNTILWANNLKPNSIRPGQEIIILPVSGVLHQVQEGETVESVAALYGVEMATILKYNRNFSDTLIIPGAKPAKISTALAAANLPNLPGYFLLPTTGWNWGRIHPVNGVDIANACGTPIYAAAEGLVAVEKSYGWNDGYGHHVDIEHPNGVITRYAHTQKNAVAVGDYVAQGDLIAFIGNTGLTHGPTGCHLHFEVRGARNPFAK